MAAYYPIFLRCIDVLILLPLFALMAISIPLMDSQICLPPSWDPIHPKPLTDLMARYGEAYGDYLTVERPFFLVGLAWVGTFFIWPLSIFCCYGILGRKRWFQNACLMVGVSSSTGMAAIAAELMGSGRASNKMYRIYVPSAIFILIATVRGLVPCSPGTKKTAVVSSPAARKKRA